MCTIAEPIKLKCTAVSFHVQAGKSNLIEAIRFALGADARNIRTSKLSTTGNDNKAAHENPSVILQFTQTSGSAPAVTAGACLIGDQRCRRRSLFSPCLYMLALTWISCRQFRWNGAIVHLKELRTELRLRNIASDADSFFIPQVSCKLCKARKAIPAASMRNEH